METVRRHKYCIGEVVRIKADNNSFLPHIPGKLGLIVSYNHDEYMPTYNILIGDKIVPGVREYEFNLVYV